MRPSTLDCCNVVRTKHLVFTFVLNEILLAYSSACISAFRSQTGGQKALYLAGHADLVLCWGCYQLHLGQCIHLFEAVSQ